MKVEIIEDPTDPRIADYREARDGHLRRHDGLFLVEGRLVVRRLLDASRFRIRSLLSTRRALDDLIEVLAGRDSLRAYQASIETIRAIVGFKFHRGCLALGERARPTAAHEVIAPAGPRILLPLEGRADPHHFGAVLRDAVALGATRVRLSRGCPDPLSRKASRVSMGATLAIPFARTEWADGLAALRGAGYVLVALTPDRRADAIDAVAARRVPSGRLALIVGAEGAGLSQESRAAADLRVRIPMAPGADSLNVATACGIALHRLTVDAGSGIMTGDRS